MDCGSKPFKTKTNSYLSCYEDSFNLNNYCNYPINILCHEAKACLLSYKICSVSCSKVLYIYGAIFIKIIYSYENDCKKHSQIFIKPFSREICLSDPSTKVVSISANIVNKYTKRLCNDILLGFYNIQFNVKVKVLHETPCDNLNEKNLSDICTTNVINICDDPCDDIRTDEPMPFTMQSSIEHRILNDIQNDCFNSITSTPYNTRL